MSAPYEGSCLCGAVRISASAEPVGVVSCFCDHCSKGSGGFSQTIARFKVEDVKVTSDDGAIKEHEFTDTSSGNPKLKTFCGTCGCPLWTVPAAAKGVLLLIRTILFENGSSLKPGDEVFTKNRPEWLQPAAGASQWHKLKQ